jgi:hypothetical protein
VPPCGNTRSHPDCHAAHLPPRSSAVLSGTSKIDPTRRDHHLQVIAERGPVGWQRASGYNWRALVEADVSRLKGVIGDGLRFLEQQTSFD